MVLEELFSAAWVRHRPYLAFVFGFFFTFIAFLLSALFFRSTMSVATIFLTTLLLIPTLIMLLRMEEKVERRYGTEHFFRNHKDIFEVYLFSFLGVFAAFVIIGLGMYSRPASYSQLFEFQNRFLEFRQGIDQGVIQSFVQEGRPATLSQAVGVFANNLLIVVICFVLSFLYGASAIFLIILNGSVFASFIVLVVKTLSENVTQGIHAFLFLLIHLVPEVSGFLLAAIAGGVVSKAVIVEKKDSVAFRNVFKDATILLLVAIGLVLLSALLEVFVTARLFQLFF